MIRKLFTFFLFFVCFSCGYTESFAIKNIKGTAVLDISNLERIQQAPTCAEGDFQFVKDSEVINLDFDWNFLACSFTFGRCYGATDETGLDAGVLPGGIPVPTVFLVNVRVDPIQQEKSTQFGCNIFLSLGCAIGFVHTLAEPPPALSRGCSDGEIRCVSAQDFISSDSIFGDFRGSLFAADDLEGGIPRRVSVGELKGNLDIGSPIGGPIPAVELVSQPTLIDATVAIAYDPFIGLNGRLYEAHTFVGTPSTAQFRALDQVGVGLILLVPETRTIGNSGFIAGLGVAVQYATQVDLSGNPLNGSFYMGENNGNNAIYRQSSVDVSDELESVVHGTSIQELHFDNFNQELYNCSDSGIQVYSEDLVLQRSVSTNCDSIDVDVVSDKVYTITAGDGIRRFDRRTLDLEETFNVDSVRTETRVKIDGFEQKGYVLSRISTGSAAIAKIDLCSTF